MVQYILHAIFILSVIAPINGSAYERDLDKTLFAISSSICQMDDDTLSMLCPIADDTQTIVTKTERICLKQSGGLYDYSTSPRTLQTLCSIRGTLFSYKCGYTK